MNKFAALNIKQPSDILFNYSILGEFESCVCWAFLFYSHRGVDTPIKGGKILDRVESTKFSQFFQNTVFGGRVILIPD